jgi:DNA-binding NarL/FixJ family response regulator
MSVDSPTRVLVVAPTPSQAADLAALVRAGGLAVVGERQHLDGRSSIGALDVIVVAAGMPILGEAGSGEVPGVVIVGADRVLAERLARDGARAVGIVHADADAATVCAAIMAVAMGLSVHPPDMPDPETLAGGRRSSAPDSDAEALDRLMEPEPLTAREVDVLDSLAQGLSNRAIAGRLGISEHTVKFHLASIFGKLDVTTRIGAVRRALRRGLIDL